jgi:hypothetical protein
MFRQGSLSFELLGRGKHLLRANRVLFLRWSHPSFRGRGLSLLVICRPNRLSMAAHGSHLVPYDTGEAVGHSMISVASRLLAHRLQDARENSAKDRNSRHPEPGPMPERDHLGPHLASVTRGAGDWCVQASSKPSPGIACGSNGNKRQPTKEDGIRPQQGSEAIHQHGTVSQQ